jgi:hypothetical protein
MRWHHLIGLVAAAFVFTWIFSGLMSMNPLGVFSSTREAIDSERYRGGGGGGWGAGEPRAAGGGWRALQAGGDPVAAHRRRAVRVLLDGQGDTRIVSSAEGRCRSRASCLLRGCSRRRPMSDAPMQGSRSSSRRMPISIRARPRP